MKATTNTRLNIDTLVAHLGVDHLIVRGDPDSTESKEVEADIPDLEERLATYTYVEPPDPATSGPDLAPLREAVAKATTVAGLRGAVLGVVDALAAPATAPVID